MQRYILKRLFQAVICLIGVSIIVFFLTRLSGDPTVLMLGSDASPEDFEAMRQYLGLDQPLYIQYFKYVAGMVQGDFGTSIRYNVPTIDVFMERFPNTLILAFAAIAWAIIIGVPSGILSAVKIGTWFDKFGKIFALLGQAIPGFWLGIMLILVFAVTLGWLPTSGMGGLKHIILPSFSLGYFFTAALMRPTRSSMLDVLDSQYIKMARIKGLPERLVIL